MHSLSTGHCGTGHMDATSAGVIPSWIFEMLIFYLFEGTKALDFYKVDYKSDHGNETRGGHPKVCRKLSIFQQTLEMMLINIVNAKNELSLMKLVACYVSTVLNVRNGFSL